ncbi:lipopolysaccharide transport periplasmic protein LptA [Defluviimonas sp. WL0024]|uniref:Lipopolysaccharide transport periplasmic protein LptA n=2 Tax=Albidovulum TaxID=205889 RepID=A0ABT3J151_9RHOB|nr:MULTISPECIES: lipopolysaccharide transport periplasmic protein LptA [Defluviimonas]MCU9848167.1 lipopolysaccharide transport periplasmic protein LptA [Defluviimonas sp. WL0024]MCW3781403.1 lipopolysaccharide transport periplasmic protein LptA [Defluviimonas salinarum]
MPTIFRALTAALALAAAAPLAARAQTAEVAFGGIKADPELPVEVTSERLAVNQNDGTALFTGDVVVIQGEMRLTAPKVLVEYATGDQRRIERMHATGGVTLVSATEAAESDEAVYTVDTGEVVMTGSVLLTQAGSTIAGKVLTVDLTTGTGQMEGRVRTILQPGTQK